MRRLTRLIALALVLTLAGGARAGGDPREEKALKVAQSWLALVDTGQYGPAYDQSAAMLKKSISRDKFALSLKSARGPLGKLKSRKLTSRQFVANLPGGGPGEYVVIQYAATFEKGSGVETVTPMKDTDGQWRVAGYYVR